MSLSLQAGSNLERIYIISLSNVRRRLFDSQSDLAERGKEALGQVRYNEDELPEESQKSILRHSSD